MSLLEKKIAYVGSPVSARAIEDVIARERALQETQVSTLERLRGRNGTLQSALGSELGTLSDLSRTLDDAQSPSFWQRMRGAFDFLPGVDASQTPRSVEARLRDQFAASQTRLQEAAAFTDRLEQAEADLFDEIDRLNGRIIESAENEARAADHVLAVQAHRTALEAQLPHIDDAETRRIQAQIDRTRRVLAEHSTKLRLYATAEERLERLRAHTARLAETIAHLRSDILRYVMAAGEQLDLVSGQINAVGAAADAAVVTLELRRALDGLHQTLQGSTQFVSQTQRYFRENIDGLIEDLGRFDARTETMLAQNLAYSEAMDELGMGEAIEMARQTQARQRIARKI